MLQLSHFGWAFRALRDDEVAAELAGVNVSRYRIYAATIGSAMIGLTGALLAYSAGFISPATYSFDRVDVRVLVMVAFGGLGTLLGPVIGASVFAVLDERLTASLELREVLYGVFVIAIFLFFRRRRRAGRRRSYEPARWASDAHSPTCNRLASSSVPRGNNPNSQTTKATLGLRELLLERSLPSRASAFPSFVWSRSSVSRGRRSGSPS